jgi:hypothetical protein
MLRTSSAAVLAALALGVPALAHHGFGRFDMQGEIHYTGTLTKIDLVNPHSYMYFDTVDAEGQPLSVKCEMRAATLIRRMGWTEDMFVIGAEVQVFARPHRDDPTSCYLEEFTIDDTAIGRNQLFGDADVDTSNRPANLPNGDPNITGDWAVEQAVLTIPPEGGNGSLVPRSVVDAFAAGEITIEEIRARAPAPPPTLVYTEAGQAAASALEMWNPDHNPRIRCEPTSLIFDWTFDWPVNRIAQEEGVIVIDYGLYNAHREIHLDQAEHPADVEPSRQGHSIGRWEGNVLHVDTVGFAPGVLGFGSPGAGAPQTPIPHSDQLHIVERYTYDPSVPSVRRDYSATDPVNLAAPYEGADIVYLSNVPYEAQRCEDLTPEFIAAQQARAAAEAAGEP